MVIWWFPKLRGETHGGDPLIPPRSCVPLRLDGLPWTPQVFLGPSEYTPLGSGKAVNSCKF